MESKTLIYFLRFPFKDFFDAHVFECILSSVASKLPCDKKVKALNIFLIRVGNSGTI